MAGRDPANHFSKNDGPPKVEPGETITLLKPPIRS